MVTQHLLVDMSLIARVSIYWECKGHSVYCDEIGAYKNTIYQQGRKQREQVVAMLRELWGQFVRNHCCCASRLLKNCVWLKKVYFGIFSINNAWDWISVPVGTLLRMTLKKRGRGYLETCRSDGNSILTVCYVFVCLLIDDISRLPHLSSIVYRPLLLLSPRSIR